MFFDNNSFTHTSFKLWISSSAVLLLFLNARKKKEKKETPPNKIVYPRHAFPGSASGVVPG
jgi:hypothetical protein